MSRCFPYPAPGYDRKCASNEALICTIKPQRVSENSKSEKKKVRRKEKKEKKREDKANGIISTEKKKKKKVLKDEKMQDAEKNGKYPGVCQIKQQESSYELMEKSSLTEEHGKPCCSSDSTENSGKRKREPSPLPGNNNTRTGTVIRIVLGSRKKDDCMTSTSSKTASLSVKTGNLDSLSQNADAAVQTPASKLRISPPKISSIQQFTISSNVEKLPCPKSNALEKLTVSSNKEKLPGKGIDQGSTSKAEKKLPRPLRKYNALFENFALPPMEVEAVSEDDDWLFGSKKDVAGEPPKRPKLCKEEVVNCGIPALQPKAQFLADVDIYALPFTVPF